MKLQITDVSAADEGLKTLAVFAERPENWARSSGPPEPPAGVKAHMMDITCYCFPENRDAPYRAIYLVTEANKEVRRRLYLFRLDKTSVPPDTMTSFTVAKYLGFRGSFENWEFGPDIEDAMGAVVVISEPLVESAPNAVFASP